MREEAIKWFEQALADLETAEDLLKTKHYYAVAFYAEQAAEKALKALLISRGKVIRTHDLVEILDVISSELKMDISSIVDDARKLTSHYTISRYPDAANAVPAKLYTESEARDLLERGKRVVQWTRQYLH